MRTPKEFLAHEWYKLWNACNRLRYKKMRLGYKRWRAQQGAGLPTYSQYGQDLFVRYYFERAFKGRGAPDSLSRKSLRFVDIGANDGISLSNTYAFCATAESTGGGK